MRTLLLMLMMASLAGRAKAQSAEKLASTFLDRYKEMADGSYASIYKLSPNRGYEVAPAFNASSTSLFAGEEGPVFQITFLRSNPNGKDFGKQTVKAFKLIAKDAAYTLKTDGPYSGDIYKEGKKIMSYWMPQDRIMDESILVTIESPLPAKPVLADETKYNHHFPVLPLVSAEPQMIIKVDSLNSNKYKLLNGIFKGNRLEKGYQRFVGYDDFLNGTWYSDHWRYDKDGSSSTDVIFCPQGSTDSIYGHLNNNVFYNFYPDSRYNSKQHASSFAANAPVWLRTTYEKHLSDKYRDDWIKSTSVSSEEMDRRSAADEARRATEEAQRCTYCGGTGSIASGQYLWGKEIYKTCPKCHGTGKIN